VALGRESPFYLAGLAGLALLTWRRPRTGAVLLGWGAAVAALEVVQHPLWPHHLVAASPLVCVAAGGIAALPWRAVAPRLQVGAAAAAVVALCSVGLVLGLRALDRPFTADTVREAVAVLRRTTAPGAVILTDDQWAVAAAGRDTPPELVDTSFVRLDSEGIDAARIEAVATRWNVAAVYTGTGRLPHIRGLTAWVQAHYHRAAAVTGNAVVYTRD